MVNRLKRKKRSAPSSSGTSEVKEVAPAVVFSKPPPSIPQSADKRKLLFSISADIGSSLMEKDAALAELVHLQVPGIQKLYEGFKAPTASDDILLRSFELFQAAIAARDYTAKAQEAMRTVVRERNVLQEKLARQDKLLKKANKTVEDLKEELKEKDRRIVRSVGYFGWLGRIEIMEEIAKDPTVRFNAEEERKEFELVFSGDPRPDDGIVVEDDPVDEGTHSSDDAQNAVDSPMMDVAPSTHDPPVMASEDPAEEVAADDS